MRPRGKRGKETTERNVRKERIQRKESEKDTRNEEKMEAGSGDDVSLVPVDST